MNTNIKHMIDCDADPFIENGWRLENHKKGGEFEWDPTKIKLYLSENQKNGKRIHGQDLLKELESQPVLNANALQYLFKHPELIPKEWESQNICFWGTRYCLSTGVGFILYLYFTGKEWQIQKGYTNYNFYPDFVAAILNP